MYLFTHIHEDSVVFMDWSYWSKMENQFALQWLAHANTIYKIAHIFPLNRNAILSYTKFP